MAKRYHLSTYMPKLFPIIFLTANLYAVFPTFSNCHENPNTIIPYGGETKDIFTNNIFSEKSNTRQVVRKQTRAQLRRPERTIIEESRKHFQSQKLIRDKSTPSVTTFTLESFIIIGGDAGVDKLLSCCYEKILHTLWDMFVEYSNDIATVAHVDIYFSSKECKGSRRRALWSPYSLRFLIIFIPHKVKSLILFQF